MTKIIIVLGGPVSGKGTLCNHIVQKYKVKHISVGELFRNEISKGSEIGKIICDSIKKSVIVDPKITLDILKNELESEKYFNQTVLLDGYPRDLANFNLWKEYLQEQKMVIETGIIYLSCGSATMYKRGLARATNIQNRFDDSDEILKKRIQVFWDETMTVVNQYKENKDTKVVTFLEIDADCSKESMFEQFDSNKDILF